MPPAAASATAPPLLELRQIRHRYGAVPALDGADLTLAPGEFVSLLGPSGCGKSTLLRVVAGLERPDSGCVQLDGTDITAWPAHRRPVNMVFQSYALFPHLTAAENIAFGLRQQGLPRAEIKGRVADALALVRLASLGARRPAQLSGGQAQRVALARALAKQPRVLLLDEPLSALDAALREQTRTELVALQQRLGTTFLMVTHDREEALSVSHRVAVMDQGRILETGTPQALFERPGSARVAALLGAVNLIQARLANSPAHGVVTVDCAALGMAALRVSGPALGAGSAVQLMLRPHALTVCPPGTAPPGYEAVAGHLLSVRYTGEGWACEAQTRTGQRLLGHWARATSTVPVPDTPVQLCFAPAAWMILPCDPG